MAHCKGVSQFSLKYPDEECDEDDDLEIGGLEEGGLLSLPFDMQIDGESDEDIENLETVLPTPGTLKIEGTSKKQPRGDITNTYAEVSAMPTVTMPRVSSAPSFFNAPMSAPSSKGLRLSSYKKSNRAFVDVSSTPRAFKALPNRIPPRPVPKPQVNFSFAGTSKFTGSYDDKLPVAKKQKM